MTHLIMHEKVQHTVKRT